MPLILLFLLAMNGSAPALAGVTESFGEQTRGYIEQDDRFGQVSMWQTNRASPQRAIALLTVGDGPDCLYSSAQLQQAFDDAPDGGNIWLEQGSYSGNFRLDSAKDLTIVGGLVDCAGDSFSGKSTLDAGGSGTVLSITAASGTPTVRLESLILESGDVASGGGGLHIDGGFWVFLSNVSISDNTTAGNGGGIYVTGSNDTAVWIDDTVISNNTADDGGGIACQAGSAGQPAVVIDQAAIFKNSATSSGGGIAADNCFVESHAGGVLFAGIWDNTAGSGGAGISASNQSVVGIVGGDAGMLLSGRPQEAAYVMSNTVDVDGNGKGGAISAYIGAEVTILNAFVSGNRAAYGGAFSLHSDATLFMGRTGGTDCLRFESDLSPAPCSQLEDNFAKKAGGVFYLTTSGDVRADVQQTMISGNDSEGQGVLSYQIGPTLDMDGNVIHGNGSGPLFHVAQASELNLDWSTIAGNSASGSLPLIRVFDSSLGTTTVRLRSSIFHDDGRDVVEVDDSSYPVDVVADCLVSHELSSLPGATDSQVVADPLFVNPADADYHLLPESPAVDFCDEGHAPDARDMDDERRGVSFGAATVTPFDAGADELLPDEIFADRFEQ